MTKETVSEELWGLDKFEQRCACVFDLEEWSSGGSSSFLSVLHVETGVSEDYGGKLLWVVLQVEGCNASLREKLLKTHLGSWPLVEQERVRTRMNKILQKHSGVLVSCWCFGLRLVAAGPNLESLWPKTLARFGTLAETEWNRQHVNSGSLASSWWTLVGPPCKF